MKNGKYIINGEERWFRYNVLHRIDGPAWIYKNGSKFWLYYGYYHRVDGPSHDWNEGDNCWWYYGSYCKNKKAYWDVDVRRKRKYEYYMREVVI